MTLLTRSGTDEPANADPDRRVGYAIPFAAGVLAIFLPATRASLLIVGFVAVAGGGLLGLAEGLRP